MNFKRFFFRRLGVLSIYAHLFYFIKKLLK